MCQYGVQFDANNPGSCLEWEVVDLVMKASIKHSLKGLAAVAFGLFAALLESGYVTAFWSRRPGFDSGSVVGFSLVDAYSTLYVDCVISCFLLTKGQGTLSSSYVCSQQKLQVLTSW